MKEILRKLKDRLGVIYAENPVRTVQWVASAVVSGLGALSIVVSAGTAAAIFGILAVVGVLLFGGELARQQVTPVAKAEAKEQAAIEAGVTPKPRKKRKAPARKKR